MLDFNCSIISAFQASERMKKDAFSGLYEAIHTGADGFDCVSVCK